MERPLEVVRSKEEMRVTTWSGIARDTPTVPPQRNNRKKTETVKYKVATSLSSLRSAQSFIVNNMNLNYRRISNKVKNVSSKSLEKVRSNDCSPNFPLSNVVAFHADEDKRVDSGGRGQRFVIPAFGGIALNSQERGQSLRAPLKCGGTRSRG